MSSKRVLVTGGAGFIGSHVADALIESGYEVAILDDLSSGKIDNLPAGARFCECDIRSADAVAFIEEFRPQVMYHLAAQMDVRKSVYDPSFDADVNVRGILNLLETGRKNGLKQVVFSSTGGAIYGDQQVYPAGEDHAEWPLSPYGIAKLATEKYLYFYHKEYGLDVASLRYANVYGPRQNPHGEAGVVAIFSDKLIAEERPSIFGDGSITRDYVFVEDVVKANIAAFGRNGYEIYNVGTGNETSVLELYEVIRELVGSDIKPKMEEPRPGEQARSSISAAKLSRELNVEISTPLRDGLRTTVEWFKARASG